MALRGSALFTRRVSTFISMLRSTTTDDQDCNLLILTLHCAHAFFRYPGRGWSFVPHRLGPSKYRAAVTRLVDGDKKCSSEAWLLGRMSILNVWICRLMPNLSVPQPARLTRTRG